MWIELTSPAKLNLFLFITGRRADGYHNLQTLFQILDRGDLMRFRLRDDGQIHLQCNIRDLPTEQNLVYRAALRLSEICESCPGIDIDLQKRLPLGGGVGGGSSNAATTLLALNHLWEMQFTTAQLASIGLQLGADIPVFVRGETAIGTGVGEQLQPFDTLARHYLVVDPGVPVNTAEIFSNPHLTRDSSAIKIAPPAADCFRNDCQAVVEELYPGVAAARIWLQKYGNARLTGTGGCVFVDFTSAADAEHALGTLPKRWQGFVAQGVKHSPLLSQLQSSGF